MERVQPSSQGLSNVPSPIDISNDVAGGGDHELLAARKGRRRVRGRFSGELIGALSTGVARWFPAMFRFGEGLIQHIGRFLLGRPVQTSIVVVNLLLFKVATNALRRARFTAHVRVLKDMKPEDLRYLLGNLPPWISSPEWEAGKPAQELLGLLWPGLNSTICLAIKNVIEDRMQRSAEYGHIKFTRFSLGRNPPQICGVKAVPLHEEDLLALVVDLDVRWAGEPDVVLELSRLKRVTLGLKNLQVSTMVRLVFTPIIEDPPFFQRMTVSLLHKPLIDFNVKVLGGPDIMSLPAISSWLHSALIGVTEKFIVWPKEVNVALIPNLRNKNSLPMLSPLASSPPLGVLIVDIEEAVLQKRRSTFLGRYKLPNPRIAMITPKDETDGVAQMTLTSVNEKTLTPSWGHSRAFVIGSMKQPLRLLLSHRRVENFFGADMPLGSAELAVWDLLDADDNGPSLLETSSVGNMSVRSFRSCLTTKSRDFSMSDFEEGYESASSGFSGYSPDMAHPLNETMNRVAFADLPSPSRSITLDALGEVGDKINNTGAGIPEEPWTPPAELPVPWQTGESMYIDPDLTDRTGAFKRLSFNKKGSSWIVINSSPAMTMSGLVNNALQPLRGVSETPLESSLAEISADSSLPKSWVTALKSFLMKSAEALQGENDDSDNESVVDETNGLNQARQPINLESLSLGRTAQTAKVKISYRWIPVSSDRPALVNVKENASRESSRHTIHGGMGPSRPPLQTSLAVGGGKAIAAGVVSIRIAFTKIDYGDNPLHPILSLSVLPVGLMSAPLEHLHVGSTLDVYSSTRGALSPLSRPANQRLFSTECQAGHRPGVLHWGQVFHVPVWKADTSKIRVELGNISSALKLSSYGPDLFLLEAGSGNFRKDVDIEASANIPLKDVLKKGFVDQNYRLREAKTENIAGVSDDQRLDVGRVAISMSWHPMSVEETAELETD
jgi:hypothetical protein